MVLSNLLRGLMGLNVSFSNSVLVVKMLVQVFWSLEILCDWVISFKSSLNIRTYWIIIFII